MIEIRQILCPIDFSDFSRRALHHAVTLARWYDSTVTLLHVYSVAPVAPVVPEMIPALVLTGEAREDILRAMTRFADAESAGTVPLQFEIAEGSPTSQILASAGARNADLLVVGTHGRSGFERFVLGSVTEKLLRKATCPVLTVPAHSGDAVPVPPLFKRIVCAIDFSDCSMRALEYATSLAQEADARLTVVHVFDLEGALRPEWRETLTSPSLRRALAAFENDRLERLARAVPATVDDYCTVETVMPRGTPYREILRLADERQAELIVMGIHGRNAADLMFFGSTTNHVVREAACPVLTIRTR